MKSTSAEAVVLALKTVFAIHGIPEEVKDFRIIFERKRVYLSQGYSTLDRRERAGRELYEEYRLPISLEKSNYRATPHPGTKKSLYDLMVNRCVRIKLPVLPDQSTLEVSTKDRNAKEKMKEYADHTRNKL